MCNWPISGNLTGTLSVGQGERGKSLEYEWRGTELGIRVEGEEEYQFVNLAGEGIGTGREIELQVGNGYIQWRYKGEEEWNNLISIDSLKGEQGIQGLPGEQGLPGKDGQDGKQGPQGIPGKDGKDGKQGPQGLPGRDGKDGKDGKNGIDGTNGQDGVTPNISVGTVTTLEPGEKATVVNSGTKENPVFDFGIPKGADGTGGSGSSASIDDNTISTNKTWSSSKIEEFALNNDNAVRTTTQGENLSIAYTKEGFLREVEILGNTIQDQDNLSDIQHLGELYVDDDGKPKLDSQGRKQYKIEIKSVNRNLINPNQTYQDNSSFNEKGEINTTNGYAILDEFIPVQANKKYYIKNGNHVISLDAEKNFINKQALWGGKGKPVVFTTHTNAKYIRLQIEWAVFPDRNLKTLQLSDSNIESTFVPHESHKTTILLPCQLMKVGNISDRLYWDGSKGRYVVEKNIGLHVLDGRESETYGSGWSVDGTAYPVQNLQLECKSNSFICNRLKTSTTWGHIETHGGERIALRLLSGNKYHPVITLSNETTNGANNVAGVREWLRNNNLNIFYQLATPQLIETNITEELKLPTYINNTYISVSGGIQGSIKAKAPIDGGKVITTLQRENIELKATNEVQDELINTTMLATDEMYMMLEPLLAEVVNLDGKRVNPLLNMYVAMIERGIKTIEQVPARYREQVKELLEYNR